MTQQRTRTDIRFKAANRRNAEDLLDRSADSKALWDAVTEALTEGTNALELGNLLLGEIERLDEEDQREASADEERDNEFEFRKGQGLV